VLNATTFGRVDPSDLASLRDLLASSDPDRRLRPVGLQTIDIGEEMLERLPERVTAIRRKGPLVIVQDRTIIRRGSDDLKTAVCRLLEPLGELRVVALGTEGEPLHADSSALNATYDAVQAAGCVISVGSGTITDIAKDSTHRAGDLPLVVVQTAVSVNAFSDDMAVLLRHGVKRTVPSRWPDALLVDQDVVTSAPPAMNRAGYGELSAMFTAPADWYLASLAGADDSFHPSVVGLFRGYAEWYLGAADGIREAEPGATVDLARLMALSGMALGIAGRTAPLSGSEHLISHMLDMAAAARGTETAFHGAQVGVASVLVALVWRHVLAELEPGSLRDHVQPSRANVREAVYDAFSGLDEDGRAADECWHDVVAKLDRWEHAGLDLAESWPTHREAISELLAEPAALVNALSRAGAPTRFGELTPAVDATTARWALANCHLMRDRFTVVDLAFLAGIWNDAFVDQILDEAAAIGAGL
jgi:glycerol-1-phosphate dehydrogenase [NAD(P)+]